MMASKVHLAEWRKSMRLMREVRWLDPDGHRLMHYYFRFNLPSLSDAWFRGLSAEERVSMAFDGWEQ